MAIGKKKTYDGKLYIIRIVNKIVDENKKAVALDMPQFEVLEKKGDKWLPRNERVSQISGDLVNLELLKDSYEGKPYDVVKMYLSDPAEGETYLVDLRMNGLTRPLYNSLLNLKNYKDLSITIYKSTSKKEPKKEYVNISVWQDGTWIKGKFEKDQIPAPEEIRDKKGVLQKVNFEEVDAFFVEKLKALAKDVKAANKTRTPSKSKTKSVESESNRASSSEDSTDAPPVDDDVPI